MVVDGDNLVLMHDRDIDVNIRSLELGAHIDSINLVTGERKRVAKNIRVSGSGGRLFQAGGRIAWRQFKSGGFKSKVVEYDVRTGRKRTLIDNLDRDATEAYILDGDADRLLVSRRYGEFLLGFSTSFDLYEGAEEVSSVVRFPSSYVKPYAYLPGAASARLVDQYVVWMDPYDGSLAVRHMDTGETRRVVLEAQSSLSD